MSALCITVIIRNAVEDGSAVCAKPQKQSPQGGSDSARHTKLPDILASRAPRDRALTRPICLPMTEEALDDNTTKRYRLVLYKA